MTAVASINCCRIHSSEERIVSVISPALSAASSSDRSDSVRATGGFSFVNPARNTSKITPVAHPRVDPYDLHHLMGHELKKSPLTYAHGYWKLYSCVAVERPAGMWQGLLARRLNPIPLEDVHGTT
jgi:hypothetical protein